MYVVLGPLGGSEYVDTGLVWPGWGLPTFYKFVARVFCNYAEKNMSSKTRTVFIYEDTIVLIYEDYLFNYRPMQYADDLCLPCLQTSGSGIAPISTST